ncbi:MAG: hypothetical protein R3Y22_08820 [Bacteroidales bacterium]
MKYKILLLFITLLLSYKINASDKQFLYYPTTSLTRSEYGGGNQSWDIAQAKNGWIYIANNNGLLEYDGSNWRTFVVSNESIIRTTHITDDGKIYVGATNEFGYFTYNRDGSLEYNSLINLAARTKENLGIIWNIVELDNKLCFISGAKEVYIYDNDSILTLMAENSITASAVIDNVLYIATNNSIYILSGDKFIQLPNCEKLKGTHVRGITELDNGEVIIATQNDGLFRYANRQLNKWNCDKSEYIKQNNLYCITTSPNYIAIGTVRGGVLLLNKQGEHIHTLVRGDGLQNNTILSAFFDKEETLWLGLDNGIDITYTNASLTNLYKDSQFIGSGYCSLLDKSDIYLGTNQGLYIDKWLNNNRVALKPKLLLNGQIWNLQKINNEIFCSHQDGLYLIKDNKAERIGSFQGAWKVMEYDKNILIVGTYNGLYVITKQNGKWIDKYKIDGYNHSCRVMEWDMDGSLWMAHGNIGIYKFRFNTVLSQIIDIKFYGAAQGLPQDINNSVFTLNNAIIFNTTKGMYKYNRSNDRIEPYNFMTNKNREREEYILFNTDIENGAWFYSNFSLGYYYENEKTLLGFCDNKLIGGFEHVHTLSKDRAIVATEDGFTYINTSRITNQHHDNKTVIRSISTTYPNESTILNNIDRENLKIKVPYRSNSLNIKWSTPAYEPYNSVNYSYKIEGVDNADWSNWSKDKEVNISGLSDGRYIFHLRSRNININDTQEQLLHILILPPWYRNNLALFVYLVIIIILITAVIWSTNRTIRKKTDKVEAASKIIIDERNTHITRLKEEQLANELRMKNEELSNSVMNVIRKNEILLNIKDIVMTIYNLNKSKERTLVGRKLLELQNTISENISSDNDWERFEKSYDSANADFLKKLKHDFPNLTMQDKKLCVFLKMGLSTKEIAPLLNISDRGVEISRYRLRKKLLLNRTDNLVETLQRYGEQESETTEE